MRRETERQEFIDAKERLKASWAADREDFSRVKEQLKRKNAEHHLTTGRLAQGLREAEAQFRALRDHVQQSGLMDGREVEEVVSTCRYARRNTARHNSKARRKVEMEESLSDTDNPDDKGAEACGADDAPVPQPRRVAHARTGSATSMARGGDSDAPDRRGGPVVGSPATPAPPYLSDGGFPDGSQPANNSEAIAKVAASATAVAEQVLSQVTATQADRNGGTLGVSVAASDQGG